MLHGSYVFYVISSLGFFRISLCSWFLCAGNYRPSKMICVLLCSFPPLWPFVFINLFPLFPFSGTDVSFLHERVTSYQILLISVFLSLNVQLSLLLLYSFTSAGFKIFLYQDLSHFMFFPMISSNYIQNLLECAETGLCSRLEFVVESSQ